jgi:hypothetical protein
VRFCFSEEIDAFSIVQLRYGEDALAFRQFFTLLDEFLQLEAYPIAGPVPAMEGVNKVCLTIDRNAWFRAIRLRPALFLGEKSLTALYALLQGDRHALKVAGVVAHEIPSLENVERHIVEKFGYPSGCDARQVLLLHSGFDEGKALEEFFQFLFLAP